MSVVKLLEAEAEEPSRPRLKIEQYMVERGLWTIGSLRKAAGLNASFYLVCRGERKATKPTIQKLADYFKIPEDEVRALFTPLEEAPDQGRLISPQKALEVFMGRPHPAPQEVASEPDGKLSVQLSTLPNGQAHLVLHMDRVMPLAEALTLLRCLGG